MFRRLFSCQDSPRLVEIGSTLSNLLSRLFVRLSKEVTQTDLPRMSVCKYTFVKPRNKFLFRANINRSNKCLLRTTTLGRRLTEGGCPTVEVKPYSADESIISRSLSTGVKKKKKNYLVH